MNTQPQTLLPMPRIGDDGTHHTHAPLTALGSAEPDPDKPFPVERLPQMIREFVEAVSAQERTKSSLAACCALGVLSASAGGGVCAQSGENRKSFANLYVLVGSESGTGKSRVYAEVAAPFLAKDSALHDDWKRTQRPGLETDIAMSRTTLKALQDRVKKEGYSDSLRNDLIECQAKLNAATAALERPSRLFTDDVTSQKLALLIQNESESFASMSSDARAVADNLLGRYHEKGSPDADFYLKAWSGDEVRVDRKGSESVIIRAPRLAALWLVQPDKVAELFAEPALVESGFLPRCLVCQVNTELIKMSEGRGTAMSSALRQKWEALVNRILAAFRLFPRSDGGDNQPVTISVTEGARQKLDDYYDEVVQDRRAGGLADVGGFAARWAEQAWRIGVVLHFAEHGESGESGVKEAREDFTAVENGTGDLPDYDPLMNSAAVAFRKRVESAPLGAATAANAIELVRWFVEQQLALLHAGRLRQQEEQHVKLNTLLDKKPAGVTARDLITNRVASEATKARGLLEQYREAGRLECIEEKPQRGGHSKQIYRRRVSTTGPADLAA